MNRRDRRLSVAIAVGVLVAASVIGLSQLPQRTRPLPASPEPGSEIASARELHERFEQAAFMLHAGQPRYALAALERVIEISPTLPEARVNAGFALLALGSPTRAREQFETAIRLRPGQANAYYGLALSHEVDGDLELALGAMQTYLHLGDSDPRHRMKAQAAIWEWRSQIEGRRGLPTDS